MAIEGALVWIDLEMTGLDVERHRIIEIAAVVTDGDLKVAAEGPDLIVHQPPEVLEAADPWSAEQHEKSGLFKTVRQAQLSDADAEAQVLEFLQSHVKEQTAPLAGNAVHQDRRFLDRYMPRIAEHLHYRNVDVSTVKEIVRRWYPEVYEQRPQKKGTHRALDDIHDSIAELAYYRDKVFR